MRQRRRSPKPGGRGEVTRWAALLRGAAVLRDAGVRGVPRGWGEGLRLHRRGLLIGAASAGGLLVAWEFLPRRYPLPLTPREGQTAFGCWMTIGNDGVVTVSVPQLEMGQGVGTVLARVVAAELGADWRQVAIQPAPPSEVWPNVPLAARWQALWSERWPKRWTTGSATALGAGSAGWWTRRWAERHRFNATADGTSLAAYEAPARLAAASARALLAMAAAARWSVAWEECIVSEGMVRHRDAKGERQLPFGVLAADAARLTPPDPPILSGGALSENPALNPSGTTPAFPRLDLPAKVDGSMLFAGDIRLPDMVYAAIRHAPVGAGAALVQGYDAAKARAVPGVLQLVAGEDWLAAVADTGWAAEQALARIAPHFTVSAPADSGQIDVALEAALKHGDGAGTVAAAGDGAQGADAMTAALGERPLRQRYDIAPAIAAGIETASATAHWRPGALGGLFGGRLDLWVATQAPEPTREAVAKALGIAVENVLLYPVAAGGSFDARLETPHAVEMAQIAHAVGRPVQLTWSRWQEVLGGVSRPPVAAEVSARLDAEGRVVAWHLRAASPGAAREMGARIFDGATRSAAMAAAGDHVDPLVLEGATPAYAIPHLLVEHVPVAVGLPCGRLRGNAHGYTAFITESFIDEIATGLHREPLSFRMAMLGDDPRLAQCLERVSALAGWNGGADGSGNGLACHRIGDAATGGCIAAIATVRREGNAVKVDRIFAVADIGRIVHVDIARQQIEGGLVFGIGLALGASPTWQQGLPGGWTLDEMSLPRLADCPDITVELLPSDADAFDPGELGVAVVAPAIANALYSATGARLRKLPLSAEDE